MIVRKTRSKGTACGLQNINKSVMAEGSVQLQFQDGRMAMIFQQTFCNHVTYCVTPNASSH